MGCTLDRQKLVVLALLCVINTGAEAVRPRGGGQKGNHQHGKPFVSDGIDIDGLQVWDTISAQDHASRRVSLTVAAVLEEDFTTGGESQSHDKDGNLYLHTPGKQAFTEGFWSGMGSHRRPEDLSFEMGIPPNPTKPPDGDCETAARRVHNEDRDANMATMLENMSGPKKWVLGNGIKKLKNAVPHQTYIDGFCASYDYQAEVFREELNRFKKMDQEDPKFATELKEFILFARSVRTGLSPGEKPSEENMKKLREKGSTPVLGPFFVGGVELKEKMCDEAWSKAKQ